MKNKWMKKILVLMMCGALAVPAAGMAQPMVAQAEETDTADAAYKTKAISLLKQYYLKEQKAIENQGKKDEAEKYRDGQIELIKSDEVTSKKVIDGIVSDAEAQFKAYGTPSATPDDSDTPDTTPTTTNNNIMVGGNWVTPVANAGQQVNVVLPVVNMGRTGVKNAVVTPAISEDAAKWPFEIETSNYSQTIDYRLAPTMADPIWIGAGS